MVKRSSSVGSSGVSIGGVISGIVVLIISLIMVAIGMTTTAGVINDTSITWANYAGGTDMLGLFPLLMLVGLVILSGVLLNMGRQGQGANVKDAVMTPIIAIVAVILLPAVMGFIESIRTHTSIALFNGMADISGILPILYVVGMIGIVGFVGVSTVRKARKNK